MDVKMPVFDGLSAAESILAEDTAGCVVLLTAFSDDEMIERPSGRRHRLPGQAGGPEIPSAGH